MTFSQPCRFCQSRAGGRAEVNIPGITFGARYDGSPIIVADGAPPPPDSANVYVPTASPGGRAPHLWLDAETSLFDRLGFAWTILRLGPSAPAVDALAAAAARRGLALTVVDVARSDALELYEAPLALIRPDQVVAWRGARDSDAVAALRIATDG